MTSRFTRLMATVSVVGLLAWLSVKTPSSGPGMSPLAEGVDPAGTEEWSAGSELPCAVPLEWRLARVDEGFELSRDEAAAAVEAAASLWEEAAGLPLFNFAPEGGLPVRFVYDDRQARAQEQRRSEAELGLRESELAAKRAEIEEWRADHEALLARYQARVQDLEERLSRHNVSVRLWNERGTVPEEVRTKLHRSEEALEVERHELELRRRELEEVQQRIRAEEERFGREVERRNREVEALDRAFPPTHVESGTYREEIRTRGGRVTFVERKIEVYRFDERSDLIRLLAHELGHALGLGHTPARGAVMSEFYDRQEEVEVPPAIHRADLELLRARCPEL